MTHTHLRFNGGDPNWAAATTTRLYSLMFLITISTRAKNRNTVLIWSTSGGKSRTRMQIKCKEKQPEAQSRCVNAVVELCFIQMNIRIRPKEELSFSVWALLHAETWYTVCCLTCSFKGNLCNFTELIWNLSYLLMFEEFSYIQIIHI